MIWRYTVLTLMVTAMTHGELFSQQGSSSAVMAVQVEIVSSIQLEARMNGDIGVQIESGTVDEKRNRMLQIGEITLFVPEGVEFSASFKSRIEMSDGRFSWGIDSQVEEKKGESGEVHYRFSGTPDTQVKAGVYRGRQVATIEYH